MAINPDLLSAPCTLYEVKRNTTMRAGKWNVWPVHVKELRTRTLDSGVEVKEALISWNNNPAKWVRLARLSRYRKSRPKEA